MHKLALMAFIRIEKKKSGNYIRVIESYREDGKSKHRIVASLGKQSDYTPEMLQRMGEKLYLLGGGELKDLLKKETKELGRFNYGFYQVTYAAMCHFNLDKYFRAYAKKSRVSFDLFNTIQLLIAERLESPGSKLKNFNIQDDYIGFEPVSLQHIYRSLDHLCKLENKTQVFLYQQGRDLFNQKIDVVFYDVTTFYFDSHQEDDFRQKGFGKDGKVGKTQIVFGMLIDKDKNPIGYQVYEGKKYEGHTFVDAVTSLKEKYHIDNVIIVADRGMLSKSNIEIVQSEDYEFIVGERLKSLPKTLKSEILDLSKYQNEWTYNKEDEAIRVRYYVTEYQGRKVITTYSQKRAEKDKFDREQSLLKSQKLLDNPSLIKNKSRRYYIKAEGNEKYSLDEDKIKEVAKYDGFISISTNNKELPIPLILDHYRHLYQIEHTFRSFKSHLEVRPMFHWTEGRIRGHLSLCYLTHVIQHYLLKQINSKKYKMSEEGLRRSLSKMQVSHLTQNGDEFYLRSNNEKEDIKQVINGLRLSELPNITSKDQIISYLKK